MTDNKKKIIPFSLKSDKPFFVTVIILCLSNFIIYKIIFFSNDSDTNIFINDFSSQISSWKAEEVVYNKDDIASLDPDLTVYKTYYSEGKEPVTLFMACYNSLEKADLSHSPIVCFTGQGWNIKENSVKEINLGDHEKQSIKVNQIVQNRGNVVMVTFYWYQTKEYAFSNRGIQKVYLFVQKLLGKTDSNAFIRLTSTVPKDSTQEESTAMLSDFLRDFYTELRRYIP